MRIEFRDAARSDLLEIRRYIAADNPEAARRVIAEIRRQIEQLRRHPLMGRPGRVDGTRELVISRSTLSTTKDIYPGTNPGSSGATSRTNSVAPHRPRTRRRWCASAPY